MCLFTTLFPPPLASRGSLIWSGHIRSKGGGHNNNGIRGCNFGHRCIGTTSNGVNDLGGNHASSSSMGCDGIWGSNITTKVVLAVFVLRVAAWVVTALGYQKCDA